MCNSDLPATIRWHCFFSAGQAEFYCCLLSMWTSQRWSSSQSPPEGRHLQSRLCYDAVLSFTELWNKLFLNVFIIFTFRCCCRVFLSWNVLKLFCITCKSIYFGVWGRGRGCRAAVWNCWLHLTGTLAMQHSQKQINELGWRLKTTLNTIVFYHPAILWLHSFRGS